MSPRRVVVFGGTFDPVHNGHIAIAKCLRDELEADSVVMVPTRRPWLRSEAPIASPEDRLRMVELAVENECRIEVSNVDILRDKTTYSIDTVNDLREHYAAANQFTFAIGTDTVPDLHRWHRFDELVKECTFTVVQRPGSPLVDTASLPDATQVVRGPMIKVSASEIRSMIRHGDLANAANVLPESVIRFIIEASLYQ